MAARSCRLRICQLLRGSPWPLTLPPGTSFRPCQGLSRIFISQCTIQNGSAIARHLVQALPGFQQGSGFGVHDLMSKIIRDGWVEEVGGLQAWAWRLLQLFQEMRYFMPSRNFRRFIDRACIQGVFLRLPVRQREQTAPMI